MSSPAFRGWSSGELSPALRGRTDLSAYAHGAAELTNFVVDKIGTAENRAGTQDVAATAGSVSSPVRLVEFVRSDDEAYALEFSDRAMRVIQGGASVVVDNSAPSPAYGDAVTAGRAYLSGSFGYVATGDHTFGVFYEPPFGGGWRDYWRVLAGASGQPAIYEANSPYAAADLGDLKVVQSGDVMTIVHPDYPVYELTRHAATSWQFSAVDAGPTIATPSGLTVGSGDAGTRYYVVSALSEDGEEGLPTDATTDANSLPAAGNPVLLAWNPVPGAVKYRVYRGDTATSVGFVGVGGGLPQDKTDTSWGTATDAVNTTTSSAWVASAAQARNALTLAAVGDKAYDEQYTITGKFSVSATGGPPVMTEGRIRVYYSRDAEPRVDSGTLVTGSQFRAFGATTAGPIPFVATVRVPDNGYAALTIDLVPEVYGTPNTGSPTYTATVDMTAGGYDVVAWRKNGVGFSDDGSVDPDYADAPRVNRAVFATPGDYPGAVTLYQQRLVLAATASEPQKTWASRSALYHDFTVSGIVRDDDAVVWTLAGRRVNEVRHLVDFDDLLQLTSGGVHVVRGNESGVLTPSGVNPRQVSSFGAAGSGQLAPIVVGDVLLYVQARGAIVRELAPTQAGGYGGSDLTVLASHLFEGYTIVDVAFQETPTPTLWVVRSDGTLLGCTYVREANVLAWHRHTIAGGATGDGFVENVCCIPEGDEDAVYLVVRRTIDGAATRRVERMGTRALIPSPTSSDDSATVLDAIGFLDAAVVYTNWLTLAPPVLTVTLTGASYDAGATLAMEAAGMSFGYGYEGVVFVLEGSDGARVRVVAGDNLSADSLEVVAESPVPESLRGVSAARLGEGVVTVPGLGHLEGEAVGVVADGEVVSNPLTDEAGDSLVVSGGAVTLPRGYAHVRVGLPYVSDLVTLDIDLGGGQSLKGDTKLNANKVGLLVERSRGLRVGPDADHLVEVKMRPTSSLAALPPLVTGYCEASIAGSFTDHGRVLVRQAEPLPAAVVAVIPGGTF